jgi:hypothetical protein
MISKGKNPFLRAWEINLRYNGFDIAGMRSGRNAVCAFTAQQPGWRTIGARDASLNAQDIVLNNISKKPGTIAPLLTIVNSGFCVFRAAASSRAAGIPGEG